jgi:transporter family-2 protein
MLSWRLGVVVLGAAFVAVQTYIVPIAGVALFSVAALAGQIGILLLVDHQVRYWLKSVIIRKRILAAVITVVAVASLCGIDLQQVSFLF